ncbi:MAG TPA: hypothetical protein VLU25_10010 [Acidobacteriota bacterium]|nr:hypothetical protein [Acidobacteriota bacterium]
MIYSLIPRQHQPEAVRRSWRANALIFERLQRQLRERDIPLIVLVAPFSQTLHVRWPSTSAS